MDSDGPTIEWNAVYNVQSWMKQFIDTYGIQGLSSDHYSLIKESNILMADHLQDLHGDVSQGYLEQSRSSEL